MTEFKFNVDISQEYIYSIQVEAATAPQAEKIALAEFRRLQVEWALNGPPESIEWGEPEAKAKVTLA